MKINKTDSLLTVGFFMSEHRDSPLHCLLVDFGVMLIFSGCRGRQPLRKETDKFKFKQTKRDAVSASPTFLYLLAFHKCYHYSFLSMQTIFCFVEDFVCVFFEHLFCDFFTTVSWKTMLHHTAWVCCF